MAKIRQRRSAQFKFQVALEAMKEQKTLSQLASEYDVHPTQITQWKKQLLEGGSSLFGQQRVREQHEQSAREAALFEQIGRLKMELEWLKTPFYGWPKMTAALRKQGYPVNGKRVRRLMRQMGVQAITVRKHPTTSTPGHRVYQYLLRNMTVEQPNQVWCADITFVPMPLGFVYLVAVMDWYSRYVLAWQLSNSLDGSFCRMALEHALRSGRPHIFNTDQGRQFTAQSFTTLLEAASVQIRMDGRGRVFDNSFIERLWRTVKYEHLYLYAYQTVAAVRQGLNGYVHFYNHNRPHQSLQYRTPAEVHFV